MLSLRNVLLVLAFVSGISCCPPERTQPVRPDKVKGWTLFEVNGVHFVGELVLSKGESSDNGKIGVTVVDIIPPDRCGHPGTYHGSPRVVLRFFRPDDRQALCDFTAVGDNKNSVLDCDTPIGISVVGVIAINTKEAWIYFDLRE